MHSGIITASKQTTLTFHMKRIFLAFGHSAGEISVPASGCRCTSLVSLLADLGEFLTREGITDSAYHRGFPGLSSGGILPGENGSPGEALKGVMSFLMTWRELLSLP